MTENYRFRRKKDKKDRSNREEWGQETGTSISKRQQRSVS